MTVHNVSYIQNNCELFEKIDSITDGAPPELVPKVESCLLRAMNSLDIYQDEALEEQVLSSLFGTWRFKSRWEYLYTKLTDINPDTLITALGHFGMEGNLPQEPQATVGDLIEHIRSTKQRGLLPNDFLQGFPPILDSFKRSHTLTAKQDLLLSKFLQESKSLSNDIKNGKIALPFIFPGRLFQVIEYVRDRMTKMLTHSSQPVGAIFSCGWPGHLVALELQFNNGIFTFNIANAGLGCEHHKFTGYKEVQSIASFSTSSGEIAFNTLLNIVIFKEFGSYFTPEFQDIAPEITFYKHILAPLTPVLHPELAGRPIQESPSCGYRSYLELLIYILQRSGEAKLGTALQEHIRDVSKKQKDLYPYLAQAIEMQYEKPDVHTLWA